MDARSGQEVTTLLGRMKVVSEAETEEAELLACVPANWPRYFADDVETVCAECGTPIIHRPYAPKKPKKVCLACLVVLLAEESPENDADTNI